MSDKPIESGLTVAGMIEYLKTLPPDLEVWFSDEERYDEYLWDPNEKYAVQYLRYVGLKDYKLLPYLTREVEYVDSVEDANGVVLG